MESKIESKIETETAARQGHGPITDRWNDIFLALYNNFEPNIESNRIETETAAR